MCPGLCSPHSSAPLLILAPHPIVLRIAAPAGGWGCRAWLLPPPLPTENRLLFLFQQQQLQHLSHHASPLPLAHPSMQPCLSAASGTAGLLALSGALMAQAQLAKEERVAQDGENRGKGKKHSWISPGAGGSSEHCTRQVQLIKYLQLGEVRSMV